MGGDPQPGMEISLQGVQIFEEGRQIIKEMAIIYKEPVSHGHGELHTAMEKLKASELDQAYASLKLNSNQRARHVLAQNQDEMDCCGNINDYRYHSQSSFNTRVDKGTQSCTPNRPNFWSCNQSFYRG